MATLRDYVGQQATVVRIYEPLVDAGYDEVTSLGYYLDLNMVTLQSHTKLSEGFGLQFPDGKVFVSFQGENITLADKKEVLARVKKDLLNRLERVDELEKESV